MILVDTSVWVDHLRSGDDTLRQLLEADEVLTHPFIIGELACGRMHNRREVLALLQGLPGTPVALDSEVLHFIQTAGLTGRGIGYVDAHLLAATKLDGRATLWTRDGRLDRVAADLGLNYST